MFAIRNEQLEAFRNAELKKFEDRMLAHLRKFFPTKCEAAGEAQLRETIRHGVNAAARYEIVSERDVCKYVDLMVAYGRDFDRDPNLPWARAILNDPSLKEPGTAVDRLLSEAMKNSKGRA